MKLSTKVLIAQCVLYILLFISPNSKVYFPSIGLYCLYLFWHLGNLKNSLWLTLLAVFPFFWGLRGFKFDLPVPFYFLLTAQFMISVFLFIDFIFSGFRQPKLKADNKNYLIFAFLLLVLISFYKSEHFILGFIGFWNLFQAVLFYILSKYFTQEKKLSELTLNSLFILGCFEGLWASLQFLAQRPIGRLLELEKEAFPLGIVAFEDVFQFRSSGTLGHPNTLLVFLGFLFPLILSQAASKKPLIKNKTLIYFSLLFSGLGIVFTMSRWGWLVIFLSAFGMLFFLMRQRQIQPFFKTKRFLVLALFLSLFLIPIVYRRVITFQSAYIGRQSSWQSRKELMLEAIVMIKQNPITGVGPGHFLIALAQNRATPVVGYFFYPVHNLYLLLASELGLPALSLFLIFVFSIIKEKLSKLRQGLGSMLWGINVGQLAGICSFIFLVLIYTGSGVNLELFFLLLGFNLEK